MSRVVLYSIISETQVIEKWICSTRSQLKNFAVLNQIQNNQNNTYLGSMDLLFPSIDLSVCFGCLGPRGSIQRTQRSVRMQNYLRVMTELFYENYDQKRFATIVKQIMNQINKIQSGQTSSEENEGLISGSSLKQDKQKFTRILAQKEYSSKRAYLITVVLFISIVILGIYYFARKNKAQS